MKKALIYGIVFTSLGFLMGDLIFNNRDILLENVNMKGEPYYFLEIGAYSDKEILKEELSDITPKVIDYHNDKYYVYVGITKSKKVAKQIKKIYQQKEITIKEKERYIDNEEFSNNVIQFDLLISATTNKEEILTIEEVVLANYEETINGSKN